VTRLLGPVLATCVVLAIATTGLAAEPDAPAGPVDSTAAVSEAGRELQERYGEHFPVSVGEPMSGGHTTVSFDRPVITGRQRPDISPFHQDLIHRALRWRLVEIEVDAFLDGLSIERVTLALFDDYRIDVATHVAPSVGADGSVVYYGQDRDAPNVFVSVTVLDGAVMARIRDGRHLDRPPEAPVGREAAVATPVLVVAHYTDSARLRYGSDAFARAKVAQYINEANTALANSRVFAHLVTVEIAAASSEDRYDVARRRDELGADIAALIFDGTILKSPGFSNQTTACGHAERWYEERPANIVASVTCADGLFTFAHEIGHVFDANHNTDLTNPPARGYTDLIGGFRTLLAKDSPPRILHFSNPLVLHEGRPTGRTDHNNVVVMNASINAVAAIGNAAPPAQATATPVPETPVPVTPSPAVGVQVGHAVSCLAGNGRIDTNLVNTGEQSAMFRMEFEGLTDRTATIAAGDWWRMPITGRADGTYDVTITREGQLVSEQRLRVACDVESPEVAEAEVGVVSACRFGNGYLLFQFVNPTDAARSYIIEFEGVPNRSTTAAPYGASVRAVTGRPDGTHRWLISANGAPVARGSATVSC